jgi:hypothetical protein
MIRRMGSMFRLQVGNGSRPGMITDDSETFSLEKLESELAGGAFGAPDTSSVSKNGSNK